MLLFSRNNLKKYFSYIKWDICEFCDKQIKDDKNTYKHYSTIKCKYAKSLSDLEKYKEKYHRYKRLYKQLNKPPTVVNNITHNNNSTNQYLNLHGYSLEALADKMGGFPILAYHNHKRASEQVANFVANNVKNQDNNFSVVCTDPERKKFYCYVNEGDKWIEDIGRQKTVTDVCKCITEYFGDSIKFIDSLVEKRKDRLENDDDAMMIAGITNAIDLERNLLSYRQRVSDTICQIESCSNGDENEFSKIYLKKLATLVRGTATQRKYVKKNAQ